MATLTTEVTRLFADESVPQPKPAPAGHRSLAQLSRRRFTLAVFAGTACTLPILSWVLWDLWSGSVSVLRVLPYSNFYDMQARALFHGHLYLPNGSMGIEAFVHDGRQYTYFGLFPSLIRVPIMLLTSDLDGRMTAPSILAAWSVTAIFSSLMIWRLRTIMVGEKLVGRAEAASYGVLMAAILGGSVILYLAATPFVFNEDFAWSVPLTVGSLFALLGVLERPSKGGVAASGVLILCANLDRSPPGWSCSIAALLVAAWFALGRGGESNRRWAIPMVAAGLIPFFVGCVVTYLKFGLPVGLPMADQIWTTVNAHRRSFLAANGGKAFSLRFLPSTLTAYLQPFGMRVSGLFPFFAPPGAPAAWLAGAVLDQSYPTASMTDTSPLLVFLGIWGTVTAFRPRGIGRVRLTRIILLAAAVGAGGVLLWGYVSQRYLADLMPFFIIAASIGLIDVWRRLEARSWGKRVLVCAAILIIGVYCVAANVAIAAFPVNQWTTPQLARFISVQRSLSIDPLADSVQHGASLPYWGPAGQIFAMSNCSGLYISTGNDMKDVPGQQLEHYTWKPVEESPSFTRTIGITFNRPAAELTHPVTIMTYGKTSLILEPDGPGYGQMHLYDSGTSVSWPSPVGGRFPLSDVAIVVTTDPNLHSMVVEWNGENMLTHYVAGDGPAVVHATTDLPGSALPAVTISKLPNRVTAQTTLCRSLAQNR